MNVKVYYRGLGWYSGRVKGDTLIYNPVKEKDPDPEYPNIYLVSRESTRLRVLASLDIKLEHISVL